MFDPELAARKDAVFQGAAHGTGSDVAMLLSNEDESVEDDIRPYDVNAEDSEGNSPLLLIAEILVVAGASVCAQTIEATLLYWPWSGRAKSSSLRCSPVSPKLMSM